MDLVTIKIISKYYNQLHAHKFDKLEEMDQFLENCKLLQLSKIKIDT